MYIGFLFIHSFIYEFSYLFIERERCPINGGTPSSHPFLIGVSMK